MRQRNQDNDRAARRLFGPPDEFAVFERLDFSQIDGKGLSGMGCERYRNETQNEMPPEHCHSCFSQHDLDPPPKASCGPGVAVDDRARPGGPEFQNVIVECISIARGRPRQRLLCCIKLPSKHLLSSFK